MISHFPEVHGRSYQCTLIIYLSQISKYIWNPLRFDLEYGTYYYQEFDAPDGYEVDDTKYEFKITEDGQVVSVVMTNKKLPVEIPKDEPKDEPKEEPTKPSVSTDSPKTGDEADVVLWAVLAGVAALAGAGLSIASIVSKKRKKEK